MQEAVQAFQQQLQAAQLELLDGDYAAVDSRLTPLLSEGCTRLCERCGYTCVADALFFLATALCTLAMDCRPVGAAPSQQLVTRAFSTCKQLQQLQKRRDDAKALLRSLLSWVYQSYACDLLTLAMSQTAEEFKDTDRVAHAFASMAAFKAADAAADIVGRSARLEGLKSRADLNGRTCHVEAHVAAKDRFQVCVDGSRESILVKRLNLHLPEVAGQSCRLVGGLSEELDTINLNLMRGFAFIVQLARADEQLVSHDDIPWPRQGVEAIARAAIIHYERGHLAEACAVFEAVEFVCTQHAVTFDEEQKEEWGMTDTLLSEHREKKMREGTGASGVLGTATTMCVLAQACLRMRGAHALAAEKLMWSRCLGFSGARASKPMREGWAAVLAVAKREQGSSRPLSWAVLSSFMELYFQGMDYAVENSDALRTTQAIMFVTDNLADPLLLINHHCSQLHLSSKILSRALLGHSVLTDGVAFGRDDGKLDPDWKNQIARSQHHQLRQQFVTMLLWVVRLRQLFDQLDDLVEAKMMTSGTDGGGLFDMRLKALPELVQYLGMLIETCCQPPWHRSTLIDILTKNLAFSRVLDYHRYLPVFGAKISSLDPGGPAFRSKGMFVMELCKDLPVFLRWFTASDAERKVLALVYGLINSLMGFGGASYDGGRLVQEQQLIRDGMHPGQFSCHAFEMLELLQTLAGAALKWETVADALLHLSGIAGGSRQARRSAEVQQKARRICNVVSQLSARFPASFIDELCKRRKRAYSALVAIIDKLVRALHAERPDAPSKGAGYMPFTQIDGMGARMPEWTAYDLHEMSMHAVALTKLATEVNTRAREAFGGNFSELNWVSDCYEYNPANAHKNPAPIQANQTSLCEAVAVCHKCWQTAWLAAARL